MFSAGAILTDSGLLPRTWAEGTGMEMSAQALEAS